MLAQPVAVFAQQLPQSATSKSDTDSAKQAGAEAAKLMQGTGVALNADGSIQLDASGNPVQKTMSVEDKLKYFQGVTGLGDVTQAANPGAGMRAGGSATLDGFVDVSCGLRAGTDFAATGVQFELVGCNLKADGKVSAMSVKVCPNQLVGDTCTEAGDYFDLTLAEGAFVTRDGIRYGLGCNTTGLCRVQVKGSYSISGTGEQLAAAAKAKRQSETANSYSSGLTKVLTDEEVGYTKRILEDGVELQACHQRSAASIAAGGPPIDCGGNMVEGILQGSSEGGSGAPKTCGDAAKCLREAVTTSTFTRTCVRTFPLTVKSTSLQYDTKLTCTEVDGKNSCDRPANAPEDWEDARDGLTLVGQAQTCIQEGESGCLKTETSYHYVDYRPQAVTTLRVSASPAPVSRANPVCDEGTSPSQRTCEGGNWFGRTLGDNECMVTYEDGGELITEQLTWQDKPGCGVCMTPTLHATCYGEPSEDDEEDTCATSELQGCVMQGEPKAGSWSDDDGRGLVISQEETYQCTTESRVCVEREAVSAECAAGNGMTVSTFGLDNASASTSADTGTFGNAMAQAAVMDGIAKGLQDSVDPNFPLIFNGEDLRCSRPTGGLGGLLSKNCCRTDLQRPKKGNIVQRGCAEAEVKLAAARRASMTVYIGEYCSKRMRFPKKCLRRTQTYCAFQGTLARIVQIQGRDQLARIAATGDGAALQRAAFNFDYYSTTETGNWTPAVTVNNVRLAAWQYPSYCRDPELAAKKFVENPEAADCPASVDLWVAACDVPGGCGAMPVAPDEGATGWGIQAVDPLKNVTTAVSRYSVVTGACDPQSEKCAYQISAWPAGQGGKVTVARDINFEIYSNLPVREGTPIVPNLGNVADLMYRTYSIPGAVRSVLPPTMRIDFSKDGGQTWARMDISTNLGTSEVSVPGTDIKVSGSCRADANSCAYRMVGTTVISQKPWGGPRSPDCTGFTPGQIGAMDFGRMDLSEWINEVVSKAAAQSEGVSNKAAAEAVKAQLSVYSDPDVAGNSSATLTSRRPETIAYAIATPGEGYGPFSVTLKASGRYPYKPENPNGGEQVTRVDVDWGDCSAIEQMTFLDTYNGQKANGYVLSHRYEAPNADKHYSCGIGKNESVLHKVKLKVYTASGVHNVSLEVKNSWNSVSGNATGNIAATTDEKSVTVKKEPPSGP